MRSIRWLWLPVLLTLLFVGPCAGHRLRPSRSLGVVVLDKTVPFANYLEHRSLFWLLDHLKVRKPDGGRYDPTVDYLGAFPGDEPGDPPSHTVDLDGATAAGADLLYLADTYGVYSEDLDSGDAMQAALERSTKIYGGLTVDEARATADALQRGTTVVAEFNSIASPTVAEAREVVEEAFGVRWTRWIGRYFTRLDDDSEVPGWMRRNYEREWNRPWRFSGAGYVLIREDAQIEVLRSGLEVERVGLTLERETPVDPLLAQSADGTPYPFWWEWIEAQPEAEVLASFQWHLTPAGKVRLRQRGVPERFPAVVRRRPAGGGVGYYFAGDFADSPMGQTPVPMAGFLTARRWIERARAVPGERAFFYRFYAPMMSQLLEDVSAP